MRVQLLPSACGLAGPGPQFLSSYLVGDEIVIDGGSIGLQADLDLQRRVRHVFLTHAHLDHVASLPLLVENVHAPGPGCVELLASAGTLATVRQDLFNGRVWPDFFALSNDVDRFVTATPIRVLEPVVRAGLTITPLPVSHGVDAIGVLVDDGTTAVAFPSDSGPTDVFWRHAGACPRLAAVFMECSFPDSLRELAAVTGHHCPSTFAVEIRKLDRDVRWIVVHRKPRYAAEIARELAAFGIPNLEFVVPGRAYDL